MRPKVAATDWAFDNLGWTRVIHSIAPDNVASQGVARKLGSRNLGPGRLPAPFDNVQIDIWGQTQEEWARARERRTAHVSR
jgi:RimJ/RimL family protein N-acetyltransferase